jgi:putative oxidoreductase
MSLLLRLRAWLEAVPYWFLAVPLRLGVAWIFWSSAQVKLINWQRTIELFRQEYQVPILPPEAAASMALSIELAAPILLVLGLFTRFAVLVLLGMTAVIQTFVYPEAWPTHLQWTAMMLVLLCRGAGLLSVDHLLWRRLANSLPSAGHPSTLKP